MKARIFVHPLLLFYSILITQTFAAVIWVAPISLFAFVAALRNRNPLFDATDMFWLLASIFFVVTPCAMLSEPEGSSWFSGGVLIRLYTGVEYAYDRYLLIQFFLGIYISHFLSLLMFPSFVRDSGRSYKLRVDHRLTLPVVVILAVVTIQTCGGWSNFSSARYDRESEVISILYLPLMGLYLASAILFLCGWKAKRANFLLLLILILTHVTMFNPLYTARFHLILGWLPILLILFPRSLLYRRFIGAALVGMIIVMPILSRTSRFGIAGLGMIDWRSLGFTTYTDLTQVLLELMVMVERYGHKFGESTLGIILFLVPRSLWVDKPKSIALYIGEELFHKSQSGTSNLAAPIFGDFYLDFGIIGVVVGSALTAILFRWLLRNLPSINNIPVLHYVVLASLPILYRGSIAATIAMPFFTFVFVYLGGRLLQVKFTFGTYAQTTRS